jgi:hypothetical protein
MYFHFGNNRYGRFRRRQRVVAPLFLPLSCGTCCLLTVLTATPGTIFSGLIYGMFGFSLLLFLLLGVGLLVYFTHRRNALHREGEGPSVIIPGTAYEKPKRKNGDFIRASDGSLLEIVDGEAAPLDIPQDDDTDDEDKPKRDK